ncbi:MAG: fimbrillin family protein [Bacteroidales bacterium]|nr:fimbrillin family protein [Bacteroidales bacterium]
MKKVVSYSVLLVLGAAILSVMACSHKDLERTVEGTSALDVYGGVSATKAVDQTWSVGDEIGVIGGDYHNALYALDETQATTSGHFSAAEGHTIYVGGTATTYTAYAPYQESSDPSVYPGENEDGVISASTASQGSTDDQEAFDFLYASGQSASAASPKVNFTFTHQMAKLVIRVNSGEGLSAEIVEYDDNEFELSGLVHSGTFTVTTGTAVADATADATSGWDLAANSVAEDTDDGVAFTAIIFPQNPTLTFFTKINLEEFEETTLPVPDGGFTAGNAYIYTITVNENGLVVGTSNDGCVITAWDVLGGDDDEDYQVNIGGN